MSTKTYQKSGYDPDARVDSSFPDERALVQRGDPEREDRLPWRRPRPAAVVDFEISESNEVGYRNPLWPARTKKH